MSGPVFGYYKEKKMKTLLVLSFISLAVGVGVLMYATCYAANYWLMAGGLFLVLSGTFLVFRCLLAEKEAYNGTQSH